MLYYFVTYNIKAGILKFPCSQSGPGECMLSTDKHRKGGFEPDLVCIYPYPRQAWRCVRGWHRLRLICFFNTSSWMRFQGGACSPKKYKHPRPNFGTGVLFFQDYSTAAGAPAAAGKAAPASPSGVLVAMSGPIMQICGNGR